jgi:opacity protein-like surface antigen
MPYGKVLFGRAVFNFPNNFANQAFTEGTLGGGLDYRLNSVLYLRGEYEYQRWFSFGMQVTAFPGSLSPSVASFGVSYHFGGNADCECGRY